MNLNRRMPNARYAQNASISVRRSRFNIPSEHKHTMDSGVLYPIYCAEVLPGDTCSMDLAFVNRMTTPIFPVMDTAYIDYHFYYVPNRLLWSHWENFCGASEDSWATPQTEYEVPQLVVPEDGWQVGDLAEMFGQPVGVANSDGDFSINALPFRAYVKIWNDWWRSTPIQDEAFHVESDATRTGKHFNSGDVSFGAIIEYDTALDGGCPLPVDKFYDRFTGCLPAPQRGPAVGVPLLGTSLLPVGAGPDNAWYDATGGNSGLHWINPDGTLSLSAPHNLYLETDDGVTQSYVDTASYTPASEVSRVVPGNLTAKLDENNSIFSDVNTIRTAFQVQKYYEALARSGSRYVEVLEGIWGVHSGDYRLQRSEFLGGRRVPINMSQVLQTSATTSTSPQGNVAANSLTSHVDRSVFTKSFVEHGYIIGVACIRNVSTYQQGIDRMWTRKKLMDFYLPQFANLGEMPVYNREICQTGVVSYDDAVFGYNEAWIEYRTKLSYITGKLRSGITGSLDSWHYGDFYDPVNGGSYYPSLSPEWLVSNTNPMKRTLAVQDEPMFVLDWSFKPTWTRPMPLYSIPGGIDHH